MMDLDVAIEYLKHNLGFTFRAFYMGTTPMFAVTDGNGKAFGTLNGLAVRNLAAYAREVAEMTAYQNSTQREIDTFQHTRGSLRKV